VPQISPARCSQAFLLGTSQIGYLETEVAESLLPAEINLGVVIGLDVNLVQDANFIILHKYARTNPLELSANCI
jgi:hypothetical protein